MKLFLIALKSPEHSVIPQCAIDALTCALAFSGCEVIALTDMPTPGWVDAVPYMDEINAYRQELVRGLTIPLHRYFSMTARYFVMKSYIEKHRTTGPIFNCDWDILVFSDLPKHFESVDGLSADLCSAFVRSSNKFQAPMVINNLKAIEFYVDLMQTYLKTHPPDTICLCDISQWYMVRQFGKFTESGSCSKIGMTTYFDPNMAVDDDVFEFDDRGKLLTFNNGLPHFTKKTTKELVRAVAIHCFIGWREHTKEIMAKLTLPAMLEKATA